MASLKDLVWYAALLFLFMFIFALLGMELFAMELKYDATLLTHHRLKFIADHIFVEFRYIKLCVPILIKMTLFDKLG